MASEGNGKGLQIFLSILSIAGLGVAAYTPLYNQIVNVEKRLASHMAERGHPWLLEKNAGARVRFQEVETRLREAKTIADLKFRELKTISMKKTREDAKTFTQILRRLREVETALARHDERMNKERQP
ncbi:MAG: hypothetical protein OXE44_04515 [Nitrospinae bacterium]|nr:hypothetical protein [Nitrospinota bacterium]